MKFSIGMLTFKLVAPLIKHRKSSLSLILKWTIILAIITIYFSFKVINFIPKKRLLDVLIPCLFYKFPVRLTEPYSSPQFSFLRNIHFHNSCTYQKYIKISLYLHQHLFFSSLWLNCPYWNEMVFHCGFDFYFCNDQWVLLFWFCIVLSILSQPHLLKFFFFI